MLLTLVAIVVFIAAALSVGAFIGVHLLLSTWLYRQGLTTDSCQVCVTLVQIWRPIMRLHFSHVELAPEALTWLSKFIGPYCALRIVKLTVSSIVVDINIAESLRGCVPSLTIEQPVIEAAVLHSCHWTVSEGLDYATRMKHAKANYLTSILEGNDLQPAVTRFDAVIDSVIAQLDLDVTNSEIRIVDEVVDFALGIICARFVLRPGCRSQESLFSVPRTIDAYQCTVYLNPITCRLPEQDNEVMMTCAHIHNVLEFPDIFSTIMQPGESPFGRGKRIKLAGHYYHCVLKVHEEQVNTFLNSFLKCIGVYEYYPYLAHCLDVSDRLDRKEATLDETVLYLADYQLYINERDAEHKIELEQSLITLETNLSLSCIMSLRRRVHGWVFENAYYPIDTDDGDEYQARAESSDGVFRCSKDLNYTGADDFDDHAMSNYLREIKPKYDEAWTPVRELLVEITAEGLIFSIFEACDEGSAQLARDSFRQRRSATTLDPQMWCKQYDGKHWGLLSGNSASASVLVLKCVDKHGIYCGASSSITREPQVRWVEINGTFGEAVLECSRGDLGTNVALPLLQFSNIRQENACDTISWSATYDSLGKSFYSIKLSDCCVDGFQWKLWKSLYNIILRGIQQKIRDPTPADNFPISYFEEERNRRDSVRKALCAEILQKLPFPATLTEGLLFCGYRIELSFVASNLHILLSIPIGFDPSSVNFAHGVMPSNLEQLLSPQLLASLNGNCVFDSDINRESVIADIELFSLRIWTGCHPSDYEMSNFYISGPGSVANLVTQKNIIDLENFHVQYQTEISDIDENTFEKTEAVDLVTSSWNGKFVQRVNLRLECEDYFNALDSEVFDSHECRGIVLLQVQIHRKESLVDSLSGTESSNHFSVAPSASTLKHTFFPFEDESSEFEFLTSHSHAKDDCQIVIDLFLISEKNTTKSRVILGTVSTKIDIPASEYHPESQDHVGDTNGVLSNRLINSVRIIHGGVMACEFVLPVRKLNGEHSVQFIRLFKELTFPVLKVQLRSLKCLIPIEEVLELGGLDDCAKSVYLKFSVPNRIRKNSVKKSRNDSDADVNAKYYEDKFFPSGYQAADKPQVLRTSKSYSLNASYGDITIDDHILLPAFYVGDEFSLLIELVAEGEFYNIVVGSTKYVISGNSSVLAFEDRTINLRDSNNLSVASLSGQLSWVDAALNLPMTSKPISAVSRLNQGIHWRRYIGKEVSVFIGNFRAAASLSRLVLLNEAISSMMGTSDVESGDEIIDTEGLRTSTAQIRRFGTSNSLSASVPDQSHDVTKIVPYFGKLVPLLGEYTSDEIKRLILKKHASLMNLIASEAACHHNYDFWEHFSSHTRCTDKRIAEYMYQPGSAISFLESIRIIQLNMVTGFKNYQFAEESWRYIVTPTWLGLPKLGSFVTKSGSEYMPMGSPVLKGYRIFVDDGTTIQSMDAGLLAIPLTGIMTSRADRTSSSSHLFQFEVAGPCTVMVCWDIRIIKLPMWLMNFGSVTGLYVATNNTKHVVYCRHVTAATVPEGRFPATIVLGGCGVYGRNKADNYFVLIGRHDPFLGVTNSVIEDRKSMANLERENSALSSTTLLPLVGRNVDDYRWMLSPNSPVNADKLGDTPGLINGLNMNLALPLDMKDVSCNGEPTRLSRITCTLHVDDIEVSVLDDIFFRTILAKKYSNIDSGAIGCKEQIVVQVFQLNCDVSMTTSDETKLITDRPMDVRCDVVFDVSIKSLIRPSYRSISASEIFQRNFMSSTSITLSFSKSRDSPKVHFIFYCPSPFAFEISGPVARLLKNLSSDLKTLCGPIIDCKTSALVALDHQIELPVHDTQKNFNSNVQDASILNTVQFVNSLGVVIGVLIKSRVSVIAKVGTSQILLNPNALSSEALTPMILNPGMELTVTTADIKSNIDLMGSLQFGIVTDGWKCEENIEIHFSGTSLYRMEPDNVEPYGEVGSKDRKFLDDGGTISSEQGISALSTIGGDQMDTKIADEGEFIDDSETWRSCSSEGSEERSNSDVFNEPISSAESQSDGHLTPTDMPVIYRNNVRSGKSCRNRSVAVHQPFNKVWILKRKKKKSPPSSPYAIEAEYKSCFENKAVNGILRRKVEIILHTNIYLLSESMNCVEFLGNGSADSINKKSNDSSFVTLNSLQRINVSLECLRECRLYFRRASPGSSGYSSLYKVALRPQAFDAKVSSALRTSLEIENSSMRIRPKVTLGGDISIDDAAADESISRKPGNRFESGTFTSALREWEIVIYPMLKIVNALPCDIRIKVVQPPMEAMNRSNNIVQAAEGACELFYLPTELNRRLIVEEVDGWRPFDATKQPGKDVCDFEVRSGSCLEIPNIDLKKTVYFRILIPGTNLWSKSYAISSPVLNNKYMFSKHAPEELAWNFTRDQDIASGCPAPPQLQFRREWANVRSVAFFSEYWIANKTSIDLHYDSKFLTTRKMKLGDLEEEAHLKEGKDLKQAYKGNIQHQSPMYNKNYGSAGGIVVPSVDFRGRVADEMLTDQINCEVADKAHISFFGGEQVPLMLTCPGRRLRIMPVSNFSEQEEIRLYVYELECGSTDDHRKKYNIFYDITTVSSVYSDRPDLKFFSLPDLFTKKANDTVYIQTIDADKSEESNNINFLTFKISQNGFVYVGIDINSKHPLSWMKILGFQDAGIEIKSYNQKISVYQLYKKFYRAHSIVHLGGCHEYFKLNNAAKMYIVVVLPCPMDYFEPTVEDIYHYDSDLMLSWIQAASSNCRQFPNFRPGESVFTDATSKVVKWSPMFDSVNVLAIQTANRDKCSKSLDYLSFQLKQPCLVFLCIDILLLSMEYPSWIFKNGYERMPLSIRTEQSVFHVFSQSYGSELCFFGGLSVPSESYICNYFILIVDQLQFRSKWRLFRQNNDNKLESVTNCKPRHEPLGAMQNNGCAVSGISSHDLYPGLGNDKKMSIYQFWNSDHSTVHPQQIPHSLFDRSWSKSTIDLRRGNAGEITAGNCVFAARVTNLPGIFYRTCFVTLLPRFIVLNETDFDLMILPFQYPNPTGFSDMEGVEPILLNRGDKCTITSFFTLSRANAKQLTKRWMLFCDAKNSMPEIREDRQEELLIQPICADDIGNQFSWMRVFPPSNIPSDLEETSVSYAILSVSVVLAGQTVALTVRDVSKTPPYRIENRLTGLSMQIRQKGSMEWIVLPPRSWRSFIWCQYNTSKLLEVKVVGSSGKSTTYGMDKIGRVAMFHWRLNIDRESAYANGSVQGYIYADGMTRVLSLCEMIDNQKDGKVGRNRYLAGFSFSTGLLSALRSFDFSKLNTQGHSMNRRKVGFQEDSTYNPEKSSFFAGWVNILQHLCVSFSLAGCAVKLVEVKEIEGGHADDVKSGANNDQISSSCVCKDLLDVSFEHIHWVFNGPGHEMIVTVFHIQIDDMKKNSKFPVVLSPINSGFNSHLNIDNSVMIPIPQVEIILEWSPNFHKLFNVKTIDVCVQQLGLRVDMDFIMQLVRFAGALMQACEESHLGAAHNSTREDIERMISQASLAVVRDQLQYTITKKVLSSTEIRFNSLIYVEFLRFSSAVVQLEIFVGKHLLHTDTSSLDNTTALGYVGLGGEMAAFLSGVVGGIGHVSPTLKFHEISIKKYFGAPEPLCQVLYTSYKRTALMQTFKIFGSMEMLGDPLSLFDNLGTGVVQFFSQTRAEVAGDSRTRGEGFKRLARAVAGGAAGSASKLTGSLADILGAVSFHDDREHLHMDALNCFGSLQPSTHLSSYFSADGDALPIRNITPNYSSTHQTHPKIAHRSTFMSGVRQSRDIMVDTVVAGLSGLVDEPIRGLQDDGVIGVAKGVAKGIVKAVASPLVGVLGAVSVLTESVEMSTRYQNGAPVGRRNIGGPSAI